MHNIIYIFNPEHDMALASASKYYMTPSHIIKMRRDLALLPMWYEEDYEVPSLVWLDDCCNSFSQERSETIDQDDLSLSYLNGMKNLFPILSSTFIGDLTVDNSSSISPWGWNAALLYKVESIPSFVSLLPGIDWIDSIRELSSREQAVKLLSLYNESTSCTFMPESESLYTLEEIEIFINKHNCVMLKAPWSGSGRGIRQVSSSLSVQDRGWATRIMRTQGCVVAEPYYNKVLDFAMEFDSTNGEMRFIGYSVFETDLNGAYKCNILDSDAALEKRLCSFVPLHEMERAREKLIQLLRQLFAPDYQGTLGVDMMICKGEDGYWIHPCVEVNLRMNMGVVSRRFYDNFVSPHSKGVYYVEHYFKQGDALVNDYDMRKKYPLVVENEKVVSGYLSLTPVQSDTLYQVYVIISVRR